MFRCFHRKRKELKQETRHLEHGTAICVWISSLRRKTSKPSKLVDTVLHTYARSRLLLARLIFSVICKKNALRVCQRAYVRSVYKGRRLLLYRLL